MPVTEASKSAHLAGGLFAGQNFSHPATARERLVVALDFPAAAPALALARSLEGKAGWLKVGKQLFTAAGPDLVRDLIAAGNRIFLDLKFHDIPTTVAGAVRAAAELGAGMLTVHAAGGTSMLRAAVEAAAQAQQPPLILAVTVLTSFRQADVNEIGIPGSLADQAVRLAELAGRAGCGGIVSSAQEASAIRAALGSDFAIVTPGIRPAAGQADDQARVFTPAAAIRAGATHLVVGRPITQAGNPRAVAEQIAAEIAAAL
jgi:orotidine-5'-phosphate decarboxylase